MSLRRNVLTFFKHYLLMTLSFSQPMLMVACLFTLCAGGISHGAYMLFFVTFLTTALFLLIMTNELFLYSRNLQRMS